jgi:hypothetical protein
VRDLIEIAAPVVQLAVEPRLAQYRKD